MKKKIYFSIKGSLLRPREEWVKIFEEHGFTHSPPLTPEISFLLVGEDCSEKTIAKAEKLKIEILNEEQAVEKMLEINPGLKNIFYPEEVTFIRNEKESGIEFFPPTPSEKKKARLEKEYGEKGFEKTLLKLKKHKVEFEKVPEIDFFDYPEKIGKGRFAYTGSFKYIGRSELEKLICYLGWTCYRMKREQRTKLDFLVIGHNGTPYFGKLKVDEVKEAGGIVMNENYFLKYVLDNFSPSDD